MEGWHGQAGDEKRARLREAAGRDAEPALAAAIDDGGFADPADWLAEVDSLVARYFELEDPRRLQPTERELAVEVVLDSEGRALFRMKFYDHVCWRLHGNVPRLLQLVYLSEGEILRYAPDEADLRAAGRKKGAGAGDAV